MMAKVRVKRSSKTNVCVCVWLSESTGCLHYISVTDTISCEASERCRATVYEMISGPDHTIRR